MTFKPGLYGDGRPLPDRSAQQWIVVAYDRETGKQLWERVATKGVPVDKRHIKSTYASATPATDGAVVVASSDRRACTPTTCDGKLLWKRDLGRMDIGAYDLPEYEWGPASSPIIWQRSGHRAGAIRRAETSSPRSTSKTGKTLWQTPREELPSWGTPTVDRTGGRPPSS